MHEFMKKEKTKYVYFFGSGQTEGRADMKNLLGGKGANLADMTSIGLPVPPGFTITTEACAYFDAHKGAYPEGLREEVLENLAKLEKLMGAKLGEPVMSVSHGTATEDSSRCSAMLSWVFLMQNSSVCSSL